MCEIFTEWLRTYPNLKVVSRDGSITYKNAISQANPSAIQISDRFHLYKNLTRYCTDYLKKVLNTNVKIRSANQEQKEYQPPLELCNSNRQLTLKEKYDKIAILQQQGLTQAQICKMLNMDVRVYKKLLSLNESELEEYFKTVVEKRANDKVKQKARLVQDVIELKEQGYSQRKIAKMTGLAKQTVAKYLKPEFNPIHSSTGSKRGSMLILYIPTAVIHLHGVLEPVSRRMRTTFTAAVPLRSYHLFRAPFPE